MFLFRDPICFHNHCVWFASILNHNVLNSASTLNGETRRNSIEGYGSLFLINSEKYLLNGVDMWETQVSKYSLRCTFDVGVDLAAMDLHVSESGVSS